MTDKKDLPAFPHQKKDGSPYWGMTIRDYFAAHADIPWSAVADSMEMKGFNNPTYEQFLEYRAKIKYMEADAMLEARGK